MCTHAIRIQRFEVYKQKRLFPDKMLNNPIQIRICSRLTLGDTFTTVTFLAIGCHSTPTNTIIFKVYLFNF